MTPERICLFFGEAIKRRLPVWKEKGRLVSCSVTCGHPLEEINQFIKEMKTYNDPTINWYLGIYPDDYLEIPNELKPVVIEAYEKKTNKTS